MTSPQRKTAAPHWPALDGWRGFSIWFAISVHAGYFTAGGVLSLDTFFVLSGFLITGLLLREWGNSSRIDLLRFWARRARRLLPALFVVLGAVLVYAAFIAPAIGLDKVRGDVLGSLGYVVNWHFIWSGQSYFGAFTSPSPVLHLWSLAVEEQFYLIWPLIVFGVLALAGKFVRRRGAMIAVGAVAIVGAVASAIEMVALYEPGADPSRVDYGTDTRAQAMLIGAALSVFVAVHGPVRSRVARGALDFAAPLCLVAVVAPWFASDTTEVHDFFYGRYGLFVYCIAVAVVLWRVVQPSTGLLGATLSLPPLIWVGAISYEMYLWHWPTYLVISADRTGLDGLALLTVRLSTVVLLAWVTHTFVAEPIRRGVRLRSPRLARIMVVGVVIALGTGVYAATTAAEPALSGKFGEVADKGGPPSVDDVAARKPAKGSGSTSTTTPGAPTTTTLPPVLKVLMAGDSQGATLAQGVHADGGIDGLSAQPGLAVWNRAILGCSIVTAPLFVIDGNTTTNRCGGSGLWQEQWQSDVDTFLPDAVVVMAGAWDVFDVLGPDGQVLHPGDPAWQSLYVRDLTTLLNELTSKGAAVVAIKPACFGSDSVDGSEPQRSERLDPARLSAITAAWEQATAANRVTLLDLDATLCPNGVSDPAIRPDGAHFTEVGADLLAPRIATAVRKAVQQNRALIAQAAAG